VKLAIVAALEALESGDQRLATDILLSALEDGPTALTFPCRTCGQRFEWPGLRDAHELHAHELRAAA
jgi:hypothetical protein